MRAALLCLLLLAPAAPRAAETELWFAGPERRDFARQITQLGQACPELRGATLVEERADGRHIRALCGRRGAEPWVLRLVAGGSGLVRAEPWARADAWSPASAGDPPLGLRPVLP